MRPMLYKELLSVRPHLMTALIIGGFLFIAELLSAEPLQGLAAILTSGLEGIILLLGAFAFALGHSQIGPELSHKHVELLDALPVDRTQVYLAKILAGSLVIVLLAAVISAGQIGITQLTWQDTAPPTMATVLGAVVVAMFSFYATGLLLSWMGGFGWALLGVGLVVLMTAAEITDSLRPLSLFHGYGAVRFVANQPQIVLWPLVFWGTYGAGCCLASGLIFVARGDRLVDLWDGLSRGLKTVIAAGVSGLLVLMATITVARLAARGGQPDGPPVLMSAGSFRVLVPANRVAAGRALVARIPEVDRRVRLLLGVEAPLSIDVELTGGGRYHTGVYSGGKIRMALGENADAVFAHEVAHAYTDQLSDRRLMRHNNETRFFNEGLAIWIAERATANTLETDSHRAWAAALHQIDRQPLDPLMDDRQRSLSHDPFEPYPLGLVFVEAVVATAGPSAVPCLIRQAALLPDRPLAGAALWSALYEGCRLDGSAIDEAYRDLLADYSERWPLAERPAIGQPVWTRNGLELVLTPLVGGPGKPLEGVRWCRFRSRVDATVADLEETMVGPDRRCPVEAIISATNTISFQVGVELPTGWIAFTPWVEHPVPSTDRALLTTHRR